LDTHLAMRFRPSRRSRIGGPREVEHLLDGQPTAYLRGSGDVLLRKRCPCPVDELAARRLIGVDVDDPLLM
jgi:hypothetical protein